MLISVGHENSFITLGLELGTRLRHNCHSHYKKLCCILRIQPSYDDV